MRHIAISAFPKASSKSNMAWSRIIQWMEKNIPGFRLVLWEDFLKHDYFPHVQTITYPYSGNGIPADDITCLIEKYPHAKKIWLYNEKDLSLDSCVKRLFIDDFEIITNIEERNNATERAATKLNLLNMNLTAFREEVVPIPFEERKYDLIYWGTWRPGRADYMKEYLRDCYVSTSPSNVPSFKMFCDNITFIDKLAWGRTQGTLGNFRFTLYIEDKQTHELFNHMSDRFYEAMSFDVIQFIDINVKNNVEKSGYDIDPWFFVSNREELEEKMEYAKNNPQEIMEKQSKLKQIVLDELKELRNKFLEIYK